MMSPRLTQYPPASAFSERRVWAAVLLAVIEDYRCEYRAAVERTSYPRSEGIITDLRYYFASRNGRMVCALAGFEDLCVELVIQRILVPKPGR